MSNVNQIINTYDSTEDSGFSKTTNIKDLNEDKKLPLNKTPLIIYEKQGKISRQKSVLNEFITPLNKKSFEIKNKKSSSMSSKELKEIMQKEKIEKFSDISISEKSHNSSILYTKEIKDSKKISNSTNEITKKKISLNKIQEENKRKLNNIKKKQEYSKKLKETNLVSVNNYMFQKPEINKTSKVRSKSGDIKSNSTFKKSINEEDSDDMYERKRANSNEKLTYIQPKSSKGIKEKNKIQNNNFVKQEKTKNSKEQAKEFARKIENQIREKEKEAKTKKQLNNSSKDSENEDRLKKVPSESSKNSEERRQKAKKKETTLNEENQSVILEQNRRRLMNNTHTLALIEAEKKSEIEKAKELSKIQYKFSTLQRFNKMDSIINAQIPGQEEEDQQGSNDVIIERNNDNIEGNNEEDEMQYNEQNDENQQKQIQEEVKISKSLVKSFLSQNRSQSNPSNIIRKPKVDSFEVLNKIRNINTKENSDSNIFKKSFSQSKVIELKKQIQVDYKTHHLFDHDNFVLSHKERRPDEESIQMQRIIQIQKMKRKENELYKLRENEDKAKRIYANLINLNMQIRNSAFENINKSSSVKTKNSKLGKKKKKVKNNYRRSNSGKEPSNNSSLIDHDHYFKEVREFINNYVDPKNKLMPELDQERAKINSIYNNHNESFKEKSQNLSRKNKEGELNRITEISEKNQKLTEISPKNMMISPKEQFSSSEINIRSKTKEYRDESDEISHKMNYFESGINSGVKTSQVKSQIDPEFASQNEISSGFSPYNLETKILKVEEMKNQLNAMKEKFDRFETPRKENYEKLNKSDDFERKKPDSRAAKSASSIENREKISSSRLESYEIQNEIEDRIRNYAALKITSLLRFKINMKKYYLNEEEEDNKEDQEYEEYEDNEEFKESNLIDHHNMTSSHNSYSENENQSYEKKMTSNKQSNRSYQNKSLENQNRGELEKISNNYSREIKVDEYLEERSQMSARSSPRNQSQPQISPREKTPTHREFIEQKSSHREKYDQDQYQPNQNINNLSSYTEQSQRIFSNSVRQISNSNSTIIISPNSVDSPRLHRITELIRRQRENSQNESQNKNDSRLITEENKSKSRNSVYSQDYDEESYVEEVSVGNFSRNENERNIKLLNDIKQSELENSQNSRNYSEKIRSNRSEPVKVESVKEQTNIDKSISENSIQEDNNANSLRRGLMKQESNENLSIKEESVKNLSIHSNLKENSVKSSKPKLNLFNLKKSNRSQNNDSINNSMISQKSKNSKTSQKESSVKAPPVDSAKIKSVRNSEEYNDDFNEYNNNSDVFEINDKIPSSDRKLNNSKFSSKSSHKSAKGEYNLSRRSEMNDSKNSIRNKIQEENNEILDNKFHYDEEYPDEEINIEDVQSHEKSINEDETKRKSISPSPPKNVLEVLERSREKPSVKEELIENNSFVSESQNVKSSNLNEREISPPKFNEENDKMKDLTNSLKSENINENFEIEFKSSRRNNKSRVSSPPKERIESKRDPLNIKEEPEDLENKTPFKDTSKVLDNSKSVLTEDCEADKDFYPIDWQISLSESSHRIIQDDSNQQLNEKSSRRIEKENIFEKKPKETTKEIKENENANINGSYDFENDNIESIDIEDDIVDLIEEGKSEKKSPLVSERKEKNSEENIQENFISLNSENQVPSITTLKSERDENIFKIKKDFNADTKNLGNLLDESEVKTITITPRVIEQNLDTLQKKRNERYDEIVESERKLKAINDKKDDIIDEQQIDNQNIKEEISNEDLELADEIAESLIQEILQEELRRGLIPIKKNYALPGLNDSNLSHLSQMSSYSNTSMFMRTVAEEKREVKNSFYCNVLGPAVVKEVISDSISTNYNNLIKNLQIPIRNDSFEMLQSLNFRERDFRFNPLNQFMYHPPPLTTVLDKKTIVSKMNNLSRQLRDNEPELQECDKIFNQCLFDAQIETLNQQRLYGNQGDPFLWSNRTRSIKFKYSNTEGCKNSLVRNVENIINDLMKTKIGLIPENNEIEPEYITMEREKRLISSISKTLNEEEESWKNYEIEETQTKLELSEKVLEQLLNEVVEILEHVHLSRKKPNLYQHKSIYACEDIPRLPFQNSLNEEDMNQ